MDYFTVDTWTAGFHVLAANAFSSTAHLSKIDAPSGAS